MVDPSLVFISVFLRPAITPWLSARFRKHPENAPSMFRPHAVAGVQCISSVARNSCSAFAANFDFPKAKVETKAVTADTTDRRVPATLCSLQQAAFVFREIS
jgi:hypothetical protein